MKKPGDASPITLITPSYWRDVELCELLCESVDRYATSYAKHVLIVADADLPLFARFTKRSARGASDVAVSAAMAAAPAAIHAARRSPLLVVAAQ